MTDYKKRAAKAARFLSYILIDKICSAWYNFKDKYSGSPHTVLPPQAGHFFRLKGEHYDCEDQGKRCFRFPGYRFC